MLSGVTEPIIYSFLIHNDKSSTDDHYILPNYVSGDSEMSRYRRVSICLSYIHCQFRFKISLFKYSVSFPERLMGCSFPVLVK